MMHKLSKERLWERVKIRWKCLSTINWRNRVTVKQLNNLRHSKFVRFYDEEDDVDHEIDPGYDRLSNILGDISYRAREVYRKKIIDNFEKLLNYFSDEAVESFS